MSLVSELPNSQQLTAWEMLIIRLSLKQNKTRKHKNQKKKNQKYKITKNMELHHSLLPNDRAKGRGEMTKRVALTGAVDVERWKCWVRYQVPSHACQAGSLHVIETRENAVKSKFNRFKKERKKKPTKMGDFHQTTMQLINVGKKSHWKNLQI
jgi:hypothetical protein